MVYPRIDRHLFELIVIVDLQCCVHFHAALSKLLKNCLPSRLILREWMKWIMQVPFYIWEIMIRVECYGYCGETILTLLSGDILPDMSLRLLLQKLSNAFFSPSFFLSFFVVVLVMVLRYRRKTANEMTEAESEKSSHSLPYSLCPNTGLKGILINSHTYAIDLFCCFLEFVLSWLHCIFNLFVGERKFKCCLETWGIFPKCL